MIRDFLTGNSTNSGSIRDSIRKTAIICESQSITFEEQEADRVRREKENQERTLQTITELRDLIALGGQRVTAKRPAPDEGRRQTTCWKCRLWVQSRQDGSRGESSG